MRSWNKLYRTEGIVLRSYKLGEADKIIVLFTKDYGIKSAVARSVRKTTSKIGARVEPFNYIDVQLCSGKSLDIISQVEIIGAYSKEISKNIQSFTAANLMCEVVEKLLIENEKALSIFSLLKGGLFSLSYRNYMPVLVSSSFCLRALSISGWAPSCFNCANCGKEGYHEYFNIYDGGAMCDECRKVGCRKIDVRTMKLLLDLFVGNWQEVAKVENFIIDEAVDVVNSYTQWHLERSLKSLQFQNIH